MSGSEHTEVPVVLGVAAGNGDGGPPRSGRVRQGVSTVAAQGKHLGNWHQYPDEELSGPLPSASLGVGGMSALLKLSR